MTTASSVRAENLAGNRALVNGGTRGTGAAVAARLKGLIQAMIQTGAGSIVH
jgi:prophage DNA circulation protein